MKGNKLNPEDFVVEIHSRDTHKVLEVFESTVRVLHIRLGASYATDITDFVPWTPKLNEWCWFLTVNSGYVLGKYAGSLSNKQYQYKLNMSDSAIFNCTKCEPFIGSLPSLLTKETK